MSEFIPITRTKIILPRRRSELLSRPRLLELIDELLDNRLIILAAPAGYGKTSLLVDFAHTTEWPVCWYSLDTLDKDPQRFIAHFISAIQQRFPGFGKSSLAALQSMGQDRLDVDVISSLIINEAYENITEHFVLVLDDFHLVVDGDDSRAAESNSPVVNFVNRFLLDMDENCHLVLASRRLLTLPDLTLMVARSQVGGLSFEELCFQSGEIQSLLRQNYQMDLSDAEAAELSRDTEGWITGLLLSTQLMGKTIANRLRVARVSGVGLYEYLAQQVLAQQPEEVQAFLLRTALLEEFDLRLCEDVIGRALDLQANWRGLMNDVLRLNLFVLPVGEDGQYLRYHHLFQEFLRDRVQRERPDEVRSIYHRLAEVYMERKDWERAYSIYQNLGDREAIVRVLELAGSSLIAQGRLVTLGKWLDDLPADLLNTSPALMSLQGAVIVMRGEYTQGLLLLNRAVEAQRKSGDQAGLTFTLNRRSGTHRLLGSYSEALADAEESIQLLTNEPNSSLYADALSTRGIVLLSIGQLNEALETMRQSLLVYQELNDFSAASRACLEIGRALRSLGRYSDAEQAYLQALEYNRSTGNLLVRGTLYNNLGVLQHARGDYVTATASFENSVQSARLAGSPRLEAYALTSIGDLYQELDVVDETLEAYRQAKDIARRIQEGYLMFYISMAEFRLFLLLDDVHRADEMLLEAEQVAQDRGSPYEQNMVLLERGRLMLVRGQAETACAHFQPALEFFLEKGFVAEAARARLYYLLALHRLGHADQILAHIADLRPLLADPAHLKQLVAAGREMKHSLSNLRLESRPRPVHDFLSSLLEQIEQYDQGIPALRRLLRRHAAVVPFAPPHMAIRALGRIQVKVSDHLVSSSDWQVQTARDLFFLLLAHPEGLTKEQIGEIFWPDSTISELKLRFKNTIYRLRHAAGKDAILFQGEDVYLFNRQMDYEYDVDTFQKEVNLSEKSTDREQRIQHCLNALKWYRGPFMPEVDFDWVAIERERLNQKYMGTLLKLAVLHYESRNYDGALSFCQRALKEDPCQEDAHRVAMRIYAAMGNRALIIRQYEQCRTALLNEVAAPPSFQTQSLYESLIQ